ncbi:MAG: TOMM precursor leader peptide-binding protein [Actinomycetales bacterium]|nr:TOMM precursor leader peptide-binding protein [Actinomycetales bacterium]
MRLRTRLVLWQGPTQVRVGTDPRWSVVLTDLSPSAARALAALPRDADERAVRAVLAAEQVAADEADAVLDHLRAARLLVPAAPSAPASPDAAAWALLEADGDASEVLARRRAACVQVTGLGRLGAGLALTLAAAGVGHLDLADTSPVTRHEVGWAGVAARDVGRPRRDAVARALHDAAPAVRTPRAPAGPPDLVVLVEHHVADPTRHRPLVTDGTPHLSVVVREASVLVGPLVRPGRTPCLRCLDALRADVDPAWPTVAAQLAVRPPEPEETLLAAVGASLAAAQALAFLDGRRAATEGATLEVALPDAVPRLARFDVHPACGCGGLPGAQTRGGAPPKRGAAGVVRA